MLLSAEDAVATGMADGIAVNRESVFEILEVHPEKTEINRDVQAARRQYDTLLLKCENEMKFIVEKENQLNSTAPTDAASVKRMAADIQIVIKKIENLIHLKERYPDLIYTDEELKQLLSSYQNAYTELKTIRRR